MTEGKTKESWQHTSSIMALIANVNRDPKKTKPFKPSDFDPMQKMTSRPDVIEVTKDNITQLKQLFTGE